jgi:hypothetical protein
MSCALNFYNDEDLDAVAKCLPAELKSDKNELRHRLNMAALYYFSANQHADKTEVPSLRIRPLQSTYNLIQKAQKRLNSLSKTPSTRKRQLTIVFEQLQKVMQFLKDLSDQDLALLDLSSKENFIKKLDWALDEIKALMSSSKKGEQLFTDSQNQAITLISNTLIKAIISVNDSKADAGAKQPDIAFYELLLELENIFKLYNININNTQSPAAISYTIDPKFYYDPSIDQYKGALGAFFKTSLYPLRQESKWDISPLKYSEEDGAILATWKRAKNYKNTNKC